MADLNDVLKTLIAEGIGEGPEGMRRIGEVILNRAAITGQTPEQIVRESGQFTGFKHPGSATRRAMSDPAAVAKAEAAWNLAQQPGDPTNGANFYHTPAVNPSWDNHMTNKGQYGNHIFYADRPIPPGEIPNAVGTLTDTVPPRAPTPVTPSIDMAQMRRTAVPSQLGPDTFASLAKPQRPGTMTRAADIGLTDKTAVTPYLKRDGSGITDPAGIVFGGEMTTRLPGGMQIPQPTIEQATQLPAAALPRPRPLHAAPDMISTSLQRTYHTNPIQLPPVPPTTLGHPPAERTVQSIPVRVAPFVPDTRYIEPLNAKAPAIQTGLAGRVALPPGVRPQIPSTTPAARTAFVPEPRYIEPRNLVADSLQPNGSIVPNKGRERLAAGLPLAPASELSTAPMPAMPRPRPNLGMGGVDIPAAISQTGQVAPTPMPRLDRGGIFGKPQIAGHDVPLPGLFGLLQGITKGMNNASGPFSNGGENALYQMMRGGNQSRPSTATAQAGGFLYAPNPNGGGLVNVGRAPTYQNPDRFGQGGTTNGAVQPRGTLF